MDPPPHALPAPRAPALPTRLLRRIAKNLRNNTPWGLVQTALTAIDDLAFEWRYGVDTGGTTQLGELAIDSRHIAHGVYYAPTRVRHFKAILRRLSLPKGSVFVDLGSGKGRMLLLAAQSGHFRKVVGVEFSAALCRAAEENIRSFQRHLASEVAFEVVQADAADYRVQPDQNVFFMYNPFDHVVMHEVLQQLGRSLAEAPRRVWVIYFNAQSACVSLLVESGYTEQGQVTYGNAKATIFAHDGDRTGLAWRTPA